jgi:hypothetical protein
MGITTSTFVYRMTTGKERNIGRTVVWRSVRTQKNADGINPWVFDLWPQ